MRSKSYFILFSFCIALITNLSAQSQSSLFQNFKSKTELLDKLYRGIQQSGETDQINKMVKIQEVNLLKAELSSLKKEIKGLNLKQHEQIYHLRSTNLDGNFELLDFYVYDYTTDYYRIIARLRCKTKIYTDFVKLRYNFYKNNSFVGTDYTYIDFESYGYSGMLPYHISFMESYTDTVNFDSIAFEISYWTENGTGDILWDQILELESNQIIKEPNFNRWIGTVKNKSNYSVKFPKIFGCIFKDENMIDMDYTYLDIQNDSLPPYTTGTFDSYIDLPPDYDKIKYYLCYSLYSLEGSGNITSNWPTFTQLKYSGSERTTLNFDMFLIDHDNDQIEVQINWNDNSNLIWQGPFYSRSVPSLNHSYSQPGTFYISSKSKDGPNSETKWSDSLKVEILSIPELKITTQQLKAGTYKKLYRDTVKAKGGITPYQWALSAGSLPNGLNLNSNNGEIFGLPSTSGSCSFCIMVTDGGNPSVSDTATFQIIINNNPPEIISANTMNIAEHEELKYTARAIDPDGNTVSYNFKNYPMWLTPADSIISGVIPEGAKDTCFMVIASDGELMDTLTVNVTVIPINDPPQIINLSDFAFENNETYSINLDTCVIDEDHAVESLTWKVIPSDGNLNMDMTNHIANFNAPNWTGTTEVKFIVTDPEGASDSAMINVTVELPSTVKNNRNIIPKDFFLSQNYPNPFNPQTTIHFGIPKSSEISIIVYNVKGEIIEYIFKGKKEAGNHFITWNANDKPSGLYFIRFQAGEFIQIKKCMLIK